MYSAHRITLPPLLQVMESCADIVFIRTRNAFQLTCSYWVCFVIYHSYFVLKSLNKYRLIFKISLLKSNYITLLFNLWKCLAYSQCISITPIPVNCLQCPAPTSPPGTSLRLCVPIIHFTCVPEET